MIKVFFNYCKFMFYAVLLLYFIPRVKVVPEYVNFLSLFVVFLLNTSWT